MDRNRALALLLSSGEDAPPPCSPQRTARFADPETFGQFLQNHREGRNVSLQRMAETTKIGVPHLQALERGDIRWWPPGIYRRAMVRAYAAAVGLDPDELVQDFQILFPDPHAAASSAASVEPEPLTAREAIERVASAMERLRHRIAASWRMPALPSWRMPTLPAWPGFPVRPLRRVGGAVALVLVGYVGAGVDLSVESAARIAHTLRPAPGASQVVRSSPPTPTPIMADSHLSKYPPDVAASETGADIQLMPAEGRLVITSNPSGARVTVNGVGWGSTPVTIRHLPMGEKRVRLWKEGYLATERDVDVTANRPTQSLQVRLQAR